MSALPPPTTIRVEHGAGGYDVIVGPGLLAEAGRYLKPIVARPAVFLVTDANVATTHAQNLESVLARDGIQTRRITVAPGEASKSIGPFARLLDDLLDAGCERSDTIVALGGGVVGDLAGFAAAVLRRGVPFVQVPTTLLAQVDSAIGGKTGIDTRHGKNLVGAFHQPKLVLADTRVLATLPQRELRAGYAEVVKYGLLADAGFFAWLEAHGAEVLAGAEAARGHAIATSCRIKAGIVAADERETGERALLNLGHTFGHALETASGHGERLLHGEAVALGLVLAFELAARLGLAPVEDARRVRRHLAEMGLPTRLDRVAGPDWSGARLAQIVAQDKKVRDGRPTLVLAHGIGRAFLSRDVALDRIAAFLDAMLAEPAGEP